MPDLLVSGSFTTIKNKLLVVSSIIKFRKSVGFDLFEPDEEWRYETEVDRPGTADVCPICSDFDREGSFQGDNVFDLFPEKQRKPSEGLAVIHPHVHWDSRYDFLRGDCRCRLFMLSVVETLTNRLHLELQGAIQT